MIHLYNTSCFGGQLIQQQKSFRQKPLEKAKRMTNVMREEVFTAQLSATTKPHVASKRPL